eukprot:CAMPEP_0196573128 /NCGR_PEP_ID=MMETSP1081-20130531/3075_1 /TAXON_ID=36882 /ORGANISM="Pyramimonas amylifera, Strain CCMP720" /LENGTH=80 /DNA_ID=CAMNT_0041890727 /DNA_START=88 /DNA_END=330 /DNA_ORIENTATION=-
MNKKALKTQAGNREQNVGLSRKQEVLSSKEVFSSKFLRVVDLEYTRPPYTPELETHGFGIKAMLYSFAQGLEMRSEFSKR